MESADSSAGSQQPNLPPGFRFHPTDEELVVHYLKKKAASAPLPVSIIAEIDLYKFDPWELPDKATFGEQEWYFFSPRDRKYPNGARPNRAATSGYWKATGTDKPVMSSGGTQKVGVKKALVFYGGKPPKGIKTNWIMHEYRIVDNKANTKPPGCEVSNKKGSLRLDDWVLCRIYKKNNTQRPMDQDRDEYSMNDIITSMPPPSLPSCPQNPKLQSPKSSNFGAFLEVNDQTLFEGMMSSSSDCINNNGYSKTQMINLKRTLPSLYWNIDESTDGTSLTKRFNNNVESSDNSVVARAEDQSNSIATLLSQLPQTHSLHQQTYEQSPVAYQLLPGMNWYSSLE